MTDNDVERRLRAVERALTDDDTQVPDLSDAAEANERLDALEAAVDDLSERLDALDATVQSLHGYVGELEAVNDRVERRADAARAAVERLEDEHRHGSAGGSLGSERTQTDSSADSGTGSSTDSGTGSKTGSNTDSGTGSRGSVEHASAAERHRNSIGRDASSSKPFDGGAEPTGDEDADSLLDRVRQSL